MTACPGVTAWSVARMRAKHQLVDRAAIFPDPFALRILGSDGGEMLYEPDSPQAVGYRAFMAARSRIADDGILAARSRGVRQIVVLGAGLDTSGLRHSDGAVRVFEVDKPAMQLWKRQHLTRIGIVPSSSLVFVPVDFERDTLPDELQRSGLDLTQPAFFVWLGVVPYFTREAITTTLRFAASLPDAGIVFDYSEPAEDLLPAARASFEQRRGQVAQVGEPWISHFRPADLHALLRQAGFSNVADHDRAGLQARFGWPPDTGSSPSRSGAHVVHAGV